MSSIDIQVYAETSMHVSYKAVLVRTCPPSSHLDSCQVLVASYTVPVLNACHYPANLYGEAIRSLGQASCMFKCAVRKLMEFDI